MDICDYRHCTGCGACMQKCPRRCISMIPDALDCLYPRINENECVSCGICQKTCPNNNKIDFHSPLSVYAAWSIDKNSRLVSASGGVAAEIYKYCLKAGVYSVGVTWDILKGAYYIPICNEEDINRVRNSKYVFSNTGTIYESIKEKLRNNIPVVFIGLPCQVSGLYSFLSKSYENLTTIDIICHGVAPNNYLEQHIRAIEKKTKCNTAFLSFRDPCYQTNTYSFTLRDDTGKVFYRNRVRSTDNYQLGFHRSLFYRDNCYSCLYARPERVGDITIGDFSGLGKSAPIDYDKANVNCLIVNTERGRKFLSKLSMSLVLKERPWEEAFKYERQLQKPSSAHRKRTRFLKIYSLERNFEKSCNKALIKDKIEVVFRVGLWGNDLRRLLKVILPKSAVIGLKRKFYNE